MNSLLFYACYFIYKGCLNSSLFIMPDFVYTIWLYKDAA